MHDEVRQRANWLIAVIGTKQEERARQALLDAVLAYR